MQIVFLEPTYLWLVAIAPLVWFVPSRATSVTSAALRSLALVLLAIGLARPSARGLEDGARHSIVVDRSESATRHGASIDALLSELEGRMPVGDRVEIVEFGRAGDAEPPAGTAFVGVPLSQLSSPATSSIGSALAEAARRIPSGDRGSVILITDGLSSERDWGLATRELVERGIPVNVVQLSLGDDDVVAIDVAPVDELRVGQLGRVRVELLARDATVDLELASDEQTLASLENVSISGRSTLELELEPRRAGFLEVALGVTVRSGANSISSNDVIRRTLAVQDPLRALYLGERVTGGPSKLRELVGAGVDFVQLPAGVAIGDYALERFDLVLIDDRSANSIPESLQEQIAEAVTDHGIGLFMCGGSGVFGPGGYHETPVGRVLPVEFVQKEEKRDPSTTLVVIIDTSGSMSGERVQLAKEVSRLSIRRLLPHDKVGIVEFYGTKQWAAPIQSAANSIDIQRAINRLDAGGGTVIMPAIEEAFYALQNVQTRYKHVLVLTDGGVESGDFESLLRKMAGTGINVSTVLVGGDAHSEFLVNLANWGKGRFYNASNRFNIPEILLKQPSTSKLPAYRPGSHAVRGLGGPGWWGPVSTLGLPALEGYVESRARPGAEVLVETVTNAHPVLATWRYGLGRVTTLLTEPVGAGTRAWTEWPGYGAWLLRVLSRSARARAQPFEYSIERLGDHAEISATRLVTTEVEPRVERVDSNGEPLGELVLSRVSPDLHIGKAVIAADEEIRLLANARGVRDLEPRRLVSEDIGRRVPELQVDPRLALDLARLADETGGVRARIAAAESFAPRAGGGEGVLTLTALWPVFFGLALLAYVFEIVLRRLPRRARGGLA